MSWVLSPLNFSACTQTIANLANADLQDPIAMQQARAMSHWLDMVSESNPDTTPISYPKSKPS